MEYELLVQLGLNENEIKVYIFLLKTGMSTAPQISKSTRIDKATVYRVLDMLAEKGFASEVIVKNVKQFNAVHPNKMLEKATMLHLQLEKLVPELIKLSSLQKTNAQVELLQGKEGIKAMMEDVIREGKPYFMMGHVKRFFEELSLIYLELYIKRLNKLKLPGRLLFLKDENVPSSAISKYEEQRILPDELESLISTWVYGDKTALFIMTNPVYIVLIRNKEVADSYRKVFDYIWKKRAKPSFKSQ